MPDAQHEADVADFMAKAAKRDPERFSLVCHQYPVLSNRQMARRASKEYPLAPTLTEDGPPERIHGRNRPGNRSPEFWAAYYGFELDHA